MIGPQPLFVNSFPRFIWRLASKEQNKNKNKNTNIGKNYCLLWHYLKHNLLLSWSFENNSKYLYIYRKSIYLLVYHIYFPIPFCMW